LKNQSMIMVDNKKNTAQVMSLSWMEKMGNYGGYSGEDDDMDMPEFDVQKTGNSKTIAGYDCEEYLFTSEDGKMHAWFAPDVPFDYQDYIEGFASLFNKKGEKHPMMQLSETYGYMMEMVSYDEKGDKDTRMTVTNISEEGKTINMGSYKVQSMMGGAGN
ncbi:MAG: DUF4412 domain-containing protein, partial [Cyclobacteriaceae bacterium]